jgi:hypothetical protein
MATRLKTIQFALPTYTGSAADAVTTVIGSGILYIPENSISTPITIKSAYVELGWADQITATGGTIAEHRFSFSLNDNSSITKTILPDIVNTGENMAGVIGPFDFTSYISDNLGTATSASYTSSVYFDWNTGTTLQANNLNTILTITYEYDDTAPTHIKTVWIPMESLSGALPTTETQFGINQIPNLSTFLPEEDVVIRDYYFVLEGNQQSATTTDIQLSLKIDSEDTHTTGFYEKALASEVFTRYVWSRTTDYPSTGSTHEFKLWSNVANTYHSIVSTLVVTYEFNPSTTTRVLNSIYISYEVGSPLGLAAIPSRFNRTLMLQEPGTLLLQQSAFRFNYNTNVLTTAGINIKLGDQIYGTYTNLIGLACGMACLQQRIDPDSSLGVGINSFGRGRNNLTVDAYVTDAVNEVTNLNGYFLINYHSDKHSDGVGAHSHTIFYRLYEWDAVVLDRQSINFSYYIPETNFWINSIGIISIIWDAAAANAYTVDAEVKSTEFKGGGYADIYTDTILSDPERRCSIVWMRGRDVFKRYPEDTDPERLDPRTLRQYRSFSPSGIQQSMEAMLTYHSIYYPLTGLIEDYVGDGENIIVDFFRTYDDSKILSLTTGVSGSFTGSWYDNTEDIYCVARETNNHVGRSADGKV